MNRTFHASIRLAFSVVVFVSLSTSAVTRYVDANNLIPHPPFTNWDSAARIIQDAVDVADPGDEILVSDGIYADGGRAVFGVMTNRVALYKPLTLRSVNGPQLTVIRGAQLPGLTNGDSAVRCVYLTNGASLSGFTLSNGATRAAGDLFLEQSGAGMWCEPGFTVVSNCLITGNTASFMAGGAFGGTLVNCIVSRSSAGYAGGVSDGALHNCIVSGNTAHHSGGGAKGSTLVNCTIIDNRAAVFGGAVSHSSLRNCITYFNRADEGANFDNNSSLHFCCATPQPEPHHGSGNITDEPLFLNQAVGDLRLQSNSPCINAGHNQYVSVAADLTGSPRTAGGTVDIGAYECQSPASTISHAWLLHYGLSPDGLADTADPDRDGMNNWQEWRADTVPTNTASALRLCSPSVVPSGVSLVWESVNTRRYWIERATNLGPQAFIELCASNISGEEDTTTLTLTNATWPTPSFYRVGVHD